MRHLTACFFLFASFFSTVLGQCDCPPLSQRTDVTVTDNGEGTGTTTWTCDNNYILDGYVFVNVGQALTIEAGTIVKGAAGSGVNAAAMIVSSGGQIFAEGTEDCPIIFTFEGDALDGSTSYNTRGQWGGLIVLGDATTNFGGPAQVEGIPSDNNQATYGGSNDEDNSGVLTYVSIRHGGTLLGAANEINGLTLAGVGSGTTIHHVEVVSNLDDGIEFFGGAVTVDQALVAFCGDDSFDWDQGFHGGGSQWLAVQDQPTGEGDRGGELDGDDSDDSNVSVNEEPFSMPVIEGWTIVGVGSQQGLLFRNGSGGIVSNGLLCNTSEGIEIEHKPDEVEDAYDRWTNGELDLSNIVVTGGVDVLDYDGYTPDGQYLLDEYANEHMVINGEPEGLDYLFGFDAAGGMANNQLFLNVGQGSGHDFALGWTFCAQRGLFLQDLGAGCTNSAACNFDPAATEDDGSCLELDECGICGGSGIQTGSCDCEGNQLDAVGVCGGQCQADSDNNGVCDDQEIYGCSYPLAENFSSSVTRDDGSCIFPCEGVVNTNIFDWDGDYVVTVTDFLMMLSVYGDTDVDLDGVWDSGDDCVDTNACNYANDPSEPCAYIDILGVCGGGCEADEDNDGICDDIDNCIGIEDECGVCNGPGPTEIVIEDIVITYDSVFLPLDNDWYVFPISADTTFSYTCAPFFGGCGDPVSYQGYDYATVLIGEQCWFAENLRSENYENGDEIPSGLSVGDWSSTTSGAVAVHGEGSSTCNNYSPDGDACDEAWSLDEYGRLYNWYAVDDARGLCPSGWHVPTDGEWTVMTDHLGGSLVAGGYMKTDYGWYGGFNGTNSSGFSGLPGGFRFNDGLFKSGGDYGYWWSSSLNGSFPWSRYLNYSSEAAFPSYDYRVNGFSVRCVRDAE